jgi:type VI secretion system protein
MKTRDFLSAFEGSKGTGGNISQSIQESLQRIFNTRQGMIPHMPDYGLPDIHGIYMTLPESGKELAQQIEDVIRKYEKRLVNCQVSWLDRSEDMLIASYRITAEISGRRGERVHFLTHLQRDGSAGVHWE